MRRLLITVLLTVYANACQQELSTRNQRPTKPSEDTEPLPGYFTERTIDPNRDEILVLGDNTLKIPAHTVDFPVFVRMQRSETLVVSDDASEQLVLGSPKSDVVKVTIFESAENLTVVSSDTLKGPMRMDVLAREVQDATKLKVVAVDQPGTENERPFIIKGANLEVTSAMALTADGTVYSVGFLIRSPLLTVWAIEAEDQELTTGGTGGDNPALNDAPTISAIANQSTIVNVPITVSFSISDSDSVISCQQSVTAVSNNTSVVAASGLSIAGNNHQCQLTVTPVTGQTGSTTIRLSVSDGTSTAESSFGFSVGAVPLLMHLTFFEAGKIYYVKGSTGAWQSPEQVTDNESKPNLYSQYLGLTINSSGNPVVSFFSNRQAASDGHVSIYQKPNTSWEKSSVIASHAVNGGRFVQSRSTSNNFTQMIENSGGSSTLRYFDPNNVGSPAGIQLPAQFNSNGNFHSCVDDHDRLWFARSNFIGGGTAIDYGYRKGSDDPDSLGHVGTLVFSLDPCQPEITASDLNDSILQDVDCRNGKLTFLVSCHNAMGTTLGLAYAEKDVSNVTDPNLATSLSSTRLPANIFETAAPTKGRISRTPSGQVRIAYGLDLTNHRGPFYYNGSTWTGLQLGKLAKDFTFEFDPLGNPHVVYVLDDDNAATLHIMHWTDDGISPSTEAVYGPISNTTIQFFLGSELGISGIEGKSNH